MRTLSIRVRNSRACWACVRSWCVRWAYESGTGACTEHMRQVLMRAQSAVPSKHAVRNWCVPWAYGSGTDACTEPTCLELMRMFIVRIRNNKWCLSPPKIKVTSHQRQKGTKVQEKLCTRYFYFTMPDYLYTARNGISLQVRFLCWIEKSDASRKKLKNIKRALFAPETQSKRQVTLHDCLPSLLRVGDKWIEIYGKEKKFCTGPTRAAKISCVPSWRAQQTNQGRTPIICTQINELVTLKGTVKREENKVTMTSIE